MIWLNENDKFIGYVPLLKKKYTEEEILNMSKYNGTKGFSELSKLVMQIQGIAGYYNEYYNPYFMKTPIYFPVYRLVDTTFNFYHLNLEFFNLNHKHYNYPKDTYIDQIIDVFKCLILYKVEEYSKEDLFASKTELLQQLITHDTSNIIHNDIKNCISNAKYASTYLIQLNEIFGKNGYSISSCLYKIITDELKEKIYKQREEKQIITLTEYTY